MISHGRYTSASSPTMAPKMFVLEIVPTLLEEQARTISKNKCKTQIGLIGFGLKIHQQERKTLIKLKQALNHSKIKDRDE